MKCFQLLCWFLAAMSAHFVNGWGTSGVISAESGQPYSVIDFSGGIASQFHGGGNDLTVFKNFRITERFRLKFDVQAFNIFNHPSFDTPNNNVEFNPFFSNPPQYSAPFPNATLDPTQKNCAAPDAYVWPQRPTRPNPSHHRHAFHHG